MQRSGALFAAGMAFVGCSAVAAPAATAATAGPQPPAITLIAPRADSTFSTSWEILLYADATDPDGQIAKVEFYDGSTLLATDSDGPLYYYALRPGAAALGAHTFTARAYDDQGLATTSPEVTVTVRPPVLLQITGTVTAGVESGCLVMYPEPRTSATGPYLLLGGDRKVVTAGARLRVTGEVMSGVASYCMQGIPLRVESATPL